MPIQSVVLSLSHNSNQSFLYIKHLFVTNKITVHCRSVVMSLLSFHSDSDNNLYNVDIKVALCIGNHITEQYFLP